LAQATCARKSLWHQKTWIIRPAGHLGHNPMAFLTRPAPTGAVWADLLRATPATTDDSGFLAGPWGECLVAACQFEHSNPQWEQMPEYSDGPCGQVVDFMLECGHQLERPADKLERATHKAIKQGNLQTGPGKPVVWGAALLAQGRAPIGNAAQNDDSDSGSASGSSSGGGSDGPDISGILQGFGIKEPLPADCCMNEAVEKAPKAAPTEVLSKLPAGIVVENIKKVSDGWHEGYLLSLSAPLTPGQLPKTVLRIWRSQLSYWRVDVPTGAAVERRAMALASEAGLPTAGFLELNGAALHGCASRPPQGHSCDWALYNFVNSAPEKSVSKASRHLGDQRPILFCEQWQSYTL